MLRHTFDSDCPRYDCWIEKVVISFASCLLVNFDPIYWTSLVKSLIDSIFFFSKSYICLKEAARDLRLVYSLMINSMILLYWNFLGSLISAFIDRDSKYSFIRMIKIKKSNIAVSSYLCSIVLHIHPIAIVVSTGQRKRPSFSLWTSLKLLFNAAAVCSTRLAS